jgi:hypothetical protein
LFCDFLVAKTLVTKKERVKDTETYARRCGLSFEEATRHNEQSHNIIDMQRTGPQAHREHIERLLEDNFEIPQTNAQRRRAHLERILGRT